MRSIAFLCLLLSACGQTGPLVQPDAAHPTAPVAISPDSTED